MRPTAASSAENRQPPAPRRARLAAAATGRSGAFVALLFDELTCDEIVPRLRDATLRAPSLIGFEAANARLKKIRAAPAERQALLEAFSLLDALSISLVTVDLDAATALAERTKLSLYDASYLWLARALRRRACHP